MNNDKAKRSTTKQRNSSRLVVKTGTRAGIVIDITAAGVIIGKGGQEVGGRGGRG